NQGSDRALLGSGEDRFQWDPGDGSDLLEGQSGNDRLDFNASNANENISLFASAGRVQLTRDVAAIHMDMAGMEQLNVRALGGVDTVTVNDLGGTDASLVDVDLNAIGGSGDSQVDTVIANGSDNADHVNLSSPDGRPVV